MTVPAYHIGPLQGQPWHEDYLRHAAAARQIKAARSRHSARGTLTRSGRTLFVVGVAAFLAAALAVAVLSNRVSRQGVSNDRRPETGTARNLRS